MSSAISTFMKPLCNLRFTIYPLMISRLRYVIRITILRDWRYPSSEASRLELALNHFGSRSAFPRGACTGRSSTEPDMIHLSHASEAAHARATASKPSSTPASSFHLMRTPIDNFNNVLRSDARDRLSRSGDWRGGCEPASNIETTRASGASVRPANTLAEKKMPFLPHIP